jgi:hypothetical protein
MLNKLEYIFGLQCHHQEENDKQKIYFRSFEIELFFCEYSKQTHPSRLNTPNLMEPALGPKFYLISAVYKFSILFLILLLLISKIWM